MNNQDNIQKFNELMSQEENNNNVNIGMNKYNSSNVNYNVALSNPNLNINNSMSLNIKDNINSSENRIEQIQSNSIINQNNQQNIDYSNSNQVLYNNTGINNNNVVNNNNNVTDYNNYENKIINTEIEEKKDLSNTNLNQPNLISNYERTEFNKNIVNTNKEYKNYNNYNTKSKSNLNNDELKFMFLISLIMFIIIMFFPNIRNFISNLFNN